MWPFKFQVSTVARALFNLNVHFRIVIFFSDENYILYTFIRCVTAGICSEKRVIGRMSESVLTET
jgi:hypothetical protein